MALRVTGRQIVLALILAAGGWRSSGWVVSLRDIITTVIKVEGFPLIFICKRDAVCQHWKQTEDAEFWIILHSDKVAEVATPLKSLVILGH